ncbi:helix-turn-helix domain-containing protein [Flavobacterium reichenbachii]|uniref:Histidine kinase n=1 Tax=Flavobacterium reichenbachii TaxID=362418 RepID=A0A085ZS86_9FLAO|nr:helix-turn-helix domain-containing protein [Flavobacterium reichenbachii]KFF07300.1 histidine kinase [Flavobacterium reichenbachii]OXB13213.1 histidine kinase [Flavobacterium reichenbachii]
MIDIILSLFFFIAAIVGFATSFRVLFSKKNYSRCFFLGLFLLSLAIVSIYNFYLYANVFRDFPDLLIIAKSFIFLAAPCAFLYVRNVLFPQWFFKKYEWLHFLPFLIYFSLTLMALAGNHVDIYAIDNLLARTKSPFSMLSLSIWLLYAFCQTMMVLEYDLQKFKENQQQKIKILNWIRIYNLVVLVLFSTLFVHFFLINKIDALEFYCSFLIAAVLIFTVGWLYFKPQIFYNAEDDNSEELNFIEDNFESIISKETKFSLPVAKELTPEKKKLYLDKLESIFVSKKLFLKKDLVMRDIAEESGISVNNLSNLINSEFNLHFQDYINLKRIEYFKEKINDSDWKDLSLEGMAWASGFKSRTTCFRAFIKHTGKSPSEYFRIIRISTQKNKSYFLKDLHTEEK